MSQLDKVLAAIDAANSGDPTLEDGGPAALLYGRRMSERLAVFAPGASDLLQIAVRGQHIERWAIPRADYPMDKPGYFRWRNALKARHAQRLAEIMGEAGYPAEAAERVGQIVRKERIKSDPEAQTLEDVACLVFLEFYSDPFLAKYEEAKSVDIVQKTWRKMSEAGHAAALGLTLAPRVGEIVGKALA
ncbi:MAG TPA: DUF4202 domain-containing protein [Rhodoblastus sp.]|nr:DUF4202 domain-containing protein [Rhodoblastus sp.]